MFRIIESQAPAKQTATDTIAILCSRLQSATLLEDRRAAILGLRSFSKGYPASVASGALRPLITCLKNDVEDVDTVKIVLETLLMLFAPDVDSPEASEEIALWLADEFTQRQDNITSLLDLLESPDFYSRLYSLQLISHISTARPDRTQECIFTAPLGISRLVALLDEPREPVRNEALLLLIGLTPSSPELQKVVAFENAFDKIFALIEAEGSLSQGSGIVSDCLALLANLLNANPSNQSYFRETAGVKHLALLLSDATRPQEEPLPRWMLTDKDKNTWGLLAIVRIFLVRGSVSTPVNQKAFWQNGIMEESLHIAFDPAASTKVKAMALNTCADLIRGNPQFQESFADIDVTVTQMPPPGPGYSPVNGEEKKPIVEKVNVIEALLRLTLEPGSVQILDIRLAASECMNAFFAGHAGIKGHFLRRAIEGHKSGQDRIPNLFTVLLRPPTIRGNADPYQSWFACVLLFHLVFDDPDAKALACQVQEGDEASGEEVVTCVQAITGNLVTGLQKSDDVRISIGYLMLLCGWLWEDPAVTNDFLGEGSSIQALIQEAKQSLTSPVLLPGLCSVLLGIAYEFSTKDSPLPRATLHELLTGRLGREQYIDKITKLRHDPSVRDYEVLPQTADGDYDGGLPEIYFDKTFIDFLKDNFSRITRAIDRDPGLEISVVTKGVEKGISRELVDSLRSQVDEKGTTIQRLESDILTLRQKLEAEQNEHSKTKDQGALDLNRLKTLHEQISKRHEMELHDLDQQSKSSLDEVSKRHTEQLKELEGKLLQVSAQWEQDVAKRQQTHESEISEWRQSAKDRDNEHAEKLRHAQSQHEGEIAKLQQEVVKVTAEYEQRGAQVRKQHHAELEGLKDTVQTLEARFNKANSDHENEVQGLKKKLEDTEGKLEQAKQEHNQELQRANKEHDEKLAAVNKEHSDKLVAANKEHAEQLAAANARAEKAEKQAKETEERATKLDKAMEDMQKQLKKTQEDLKKSEEGKKEVQSELDDLLIVFGDLESKRKADKKRLKDLGEEVSEDEDEDEDEGEEGDDDGEDEGEEGSEKDDKGA